MVRYMVPAVDDIHDVRLGAHKRPGTDDAAYGENDNPDEDEENTVERDFSGPHRIPFAKAAGNRGVDADAQAGADGDHQRLHWESQGNRSQRVLTDLGDIDTVDDVVERLDHHGDDHGQRHVEEQAADGHGAQLVAVFLLWIWVLLFHCAAQSSFLPNFNRLLL